MWLFPFHTNHSYVRLQAVTEECEICSRYAVHPGFLCFELWIYAERKLHTVILLLLYFFSFLSFQADLPYSEQMSGVHSLSGPLHDPIEREKECVGKLAVASYSVAIEGVKHELSVCIHLPMEWHELDHCLQIFSSGVKKHCAIIRTQIVDTILPLGENIVFCLWRYLKVKAGYTVDIFIVKLTVLQIA